MVNRRWTCPTCGAEYELAPAPAPIGTEHHEPAAPQGTPATETQIRAIYAAAKDYPGGNDAVKNLMRQLYGVESTKSLNKDQASKLIDRLRGSSPSW